MGTTIIFKGQKYDSIEAMPEEARQAYERAMAQLADQDRDGIPDILGPGGPDNALGIQRSSFTFNGKTYNRIDEMPPFVARLAKQAMSRASQDGTTHLTFSGADVLNDTLSPQPDTNDSPLDRVEGALEGFLRIFLIVIAVAAIAGGIWIARNLDAGSRNQGGTFYVGLGVLVVLWGVLKTYRWLIVRRKMAADPSYYPDE